MFIGHATGGTKLLPPSQGEWVAVRTGPNREVRRAQAAVNSAPLGLAGECRKRRDGGHH